MSSERPSAPSHQLVELMEQHGLEVRDLVEASTDQLTFRTVQRALRGRPLSRKAMAKLLTALNSAAGTELRLRDVFQGLKPPS